MPCWQKPWWTAPSPSSQKLVVSRDLPPGWCLQVVTWRGEVVAPSPAVCTILSFGPSLVREEWWQQVTSYRCKSKHGKRSYPLPWNTPSGKQLKTVFLQHCLALCSIYGVSHPRCFFCSQHQTLIVTFQLFAEGHILEVLFLSSNRLVSNEIFPKQGAAQCK